MTATLLSLGDVFEQRYELLQVLGSGGVGTVYLARQLDAERTVAIKILQPELASDEELKQRFLREAQILSRIKHENVVQVHHLGISSLVLPFIVMEYVAGKPLRGLITEQGALGVARSISIIRQCASALIEVHSSGIIHRDLKPENIVLADERMPDAVKIIDFGLARVEDSTKQQQVLTSTGFLIGTVAYMSPEQCRGVRVDSRSDIYSLSLCFYEMLKGTPPFEADSTMGLMYKQINETLPMLDTRTFGVASEALNNFLKKGLAKNPDDRFQSAEEMLSALNDLANTACDASTAVKSDRKNALIVPGLLTLFLFLLLFVCFSFVLSPSKQSELAPLSKLAVALSIDDPLTDPAIKRVLENPGIDGESKIQLLIQDAQKNPVRALSSLKIANELCRKPLRKSKEYLRYAVLRDLGLQFLLIGDYKKALENFEAILKIEGTDKISAGFSRQRLTETKADAAFCLYALGEQERARKMVYELAKYEGGLGRGESRRVMAIALRLQDRLLINKLMRAQGSATNHAQYVMQFREARMYDLAAEALRQAKSTPIDPQFEDQESLEIEIVAQDAELLCAQGEKLRARKVLKAAMEEINVPRAANLSAAQVHFLHALKTAGLDEELLSYQPLTMIYEFVLLKAEILCSQRKFAEARGLILQNAKIPFFPEPVRKKSLDRIDQMKAGKLSDTSPLNDWSNYYL